MTLRADLHRIAMWTLIALVPLALAFAWGYSYCENQYAEVYEDYQHSRATSIAWQDSIGEELLVIGEELLVIKAKLRADDMWHFNNRVKRPKEIR